MITIPTAYIATANPARSGLTSTLQKTNYWYIHNYSISTFHRAHKQICTNAHSVPRRNKKERGNPVHGKKPQCHNSRQKCCFHPPPWVRKRPILRTTNTSFQSEKFGNIWWVLISDQVRSKWKNVTETEQKRSGKQVIWHTKKERWERQNREKGASKVCPFAEKAWSLG